jgi:hypothetical protein
MQSAISDVLEVRVRVTGSVVCAAMLVATVLTGCTRSQDATPRSTPRDAPVTPVTATNLVAGPLANTVWRVTSGNRAPGTLFIFLSNGTLMMTSCVEVYRLARWRAETMDRLTIVEDVTVQYTADIQALSEDRLSLRLNLRSEQVDLTLEAAQAPFVCPDLPR